MLGVSMVAGRLIELLLHAAVPAARHWLGLAAG